ncbi:hypothetical protein B0H16DRAFT_1742121 [Mycena metata]|uniref:DUF6534 domain-containing protein n=1 Tax=Mycena metata TaxID=1033252 RepID=A0AAD7H8U2_9AGAR|nr:hypothetical protein B0H16DRAFT_1742121 [Mycena metata]
MAAILQSSHQTFGAALFGALLAMGMYGLTSAQTYSYFLEYPKDEKWTKSLPEASRFGLFVFHLSHHYLIAEAFNPFQLSQNVWSLPATMVVHLIIAFLVMTFFLHVIFRCRCLSFIAVIWSQWYFRCSFHAETTVVVGSPERVCDTLIHRWVVTSSSLFLHSNNGATLKASASQFLIAIDAIIHTFATTSLLDVPALAVWSPSISTAAADILLASSLCFVLHDHRTSFRSTNSMLHTLMIYAINRCLLTTGVAVCSLVMIGLEPTSMIYVGPEFLFSGVYTNALLASLNSRRRIRDAPSSDYNSMQLSNIPSDKIESQNNRASHRVEVAARNPKNGPYGGASSVDDFKLKQEKIV